MNPNTTAIEVMDALLPPLAEETRTLAGVGRRLDVVSANLHRATRLCQSILQKAFTGELCS